MDPFMKIVEFVLQYPAWFRYVVVAWVVVGGVILSGFVLVQREQSVTLPEIVSFPSGDNTATIPPLQTTRPSGAGSDNNHTTVSLSVDEYATRLRALSNRFLEAQEFVDQHNGTQVEWDGLVTSVSEERSISSYMAVGLVAKSIEPSFRFMAMFPISMRTKAFSLRHGDFVRVKGKVDLSLKSSAIINATELTVLVPRKDD